jgi:hypothetical protein
MMHVMARLRCCVDLRLWNGSRPSRWLQLGIEWASRVQPSRGAPSPRDRPVVATKNPEIDAFQRLRAPRLTQWYSHYR